MQRTGVSHPKARPRPRHARNDLHVDEFYAGLAFKSTKLNRLQGFLGNDSRP